MNCVILFCVNVSIFTRHLWNPSDFFSTQLPGEMCSCRVSFQSFSLGQITHTAIDSAVVALAGPGSGQVGPWTRTLHRTIVLYVKHRHRRNVMSYRFTSFLFVSRHFFLFHIISFCFTSFLFASHHFFTLSFCLHFL